MFHAVVYHRNNSSVGLYGKENHRHFVIKTLTIQVYYTLETIC